MYEHDSKSTLLTAIFVGAGAILLLGGWWLYRKFRDNRPPDQRGFQSFGVGPRGLLAFAGMMLMLFGAAAIGVGLMFASVLR